MRMVSVPVLVFAAVFSPAHAVIISGGDGSGNTNAPPDNPGWENVGRIQHASAHSSVTYLGDKWFITAHHVQVFDNPTGVVLNSTAHGIDTNTWTRITNSNGTKADLVLFQTHSRPSAPPLRIRADRIPESAEVVMIGNGRNRDAELTYWDADWVVTNAISGVYSGYVWAAGSTKRWGENTVSSRQSFGYSYGSHSSAQEGFQTTFDATLGSNVCQGATYDSGGGVFYKNGGHWELAGIMLTVTRFPNQPTASAVYGNQSLIADISFYRDQIAETLVNFDTDADGMPDWWELLHSGSITGMVASADDDGDGFTNLQEYIADTNPTNKLSFLYISDAHIDQGHVLAFMGSTARIYQVFHTTNTLTYTNLVWTPAHTNTIPGEGPDTAIVVTNTASLGFYRLRVTLP